VGKKLPPAQETLYRRADEILHYVWDPIGVGGIPETRDEYYSYLPHVFKLLIAGADEPTIFRYLLEVERDAMGLVPRKKRAREVARLLIRNRDAVGE